MKNAILKRTLLATCITAAVLSAPLQAETTTRIIGGSVSPVGTYSWIVSLKLASDGSHFCGASLIDKQWVMTAAHCVETEKATEISVVVGEYNTQQVDSGEKKSKVEKIIIHPQRNADDNDHDIALLKLSSPIIGQTVSRATSDAMTTIKEGDLLTVMGWGNLDLNNPKYPNKLNQVQVPLANYAACNKSYDGSLTSNMICAGYSKGGKDSCQGDSGGPLVYQQDGKWHQVGVVSFGEGCALANYPGVYAKVANYGSWIDKIITGTGTGTGTGTEPSTVLDPSVFNLEETVVLYSYDGQQEEMVLALENISDKVLKIASVEVSANEFKLVDNTCSTTLKPDQSCDVTIAYSPNKDNDLSEGLMNISLEDGSNATVVLQGENLSYWQNDWLDDDFDWYTNEADWDNVDNDFKFANKNLVIGKKAILEAHLKGPGVLSFDFNISNDVNKNNMVYYVDGQPVRNIKADQKGTNQHSTKLSSGEHRVTWVYNKQVGNNGGLEIANLKYKRSATTPVVANSLKSSGGGSTGLFFLSGLVLLIGLRKLRKLLKK